MSQTRTQGDLLLQCDDISSTSDLYNSPFKSRFQIHGRRSYRSNFNQISFISSLTPLYYNPSQQRSLFNGPVANGHLPKKEDISTTYATLAVVVIFLSSLAALLYVYSTFPNVTEEEREFIKLPMNMEDAKQLGIILNRYKADHYFEVMSGVFTTYIFLQTFAIPGSLFLSIMSGFLFPFLTALILVCTCSMIGASLCFLLSQLLGRKLVKKYFPERANKWAMQVNKHQDNLLNYVIFLRVTPFLPNWFINLTAPVIGVPLIPFAVGTFIGVAPPSFIAIQAGQTLQNMTASDTAFNISTFVWLILFGFLSLIPVFLKNYFKEKLE